MNSSATPRSDHSLIITCEHGGNGIPKPYRGLFHAYQAQLTSHRGLDFGALTMAKALANAFKAPLVAATTSRLLVDLNRSVGHPRLHSDAIRGLTSDERERILELYYYPFRKQADALVRQAIKERGHVIHLSSHSFTPELNGQVRSADIGLLYDPARPGEAGFCALWQAALKCHAPALKVRRNYPYAGKGDGLTTWFRRCFPQNLYVGIELEINHKHIIGTGRHWPALRKIIIESLRAALLERTLAKLKD